MPIKVNLNGEDANIYIKHPMVRPYFKAADGIVIDKTSANTATISFPSK